MKWAKCYLLDRGYYMPAHGYEFYLRVANLRNTSEIPNQLAFKGTIYYVTIMTVISSSVKSDMKFLWESSLGISLVFI